MIANADDGECRTFQHIILGMAPGTHTGIRAINLRNCGNPDAIADGCDNQNLFLQSITQLGFQAANTIGGGWQQSNVKSYSNLAAITADSATPFRTSESGNGAAMCYRSIKGVLQNGTGGTTMQKLWPWPMNQRIIDTLTREKRPVIDVTATVEAMFGPIPAACKS